MREMEIDEGYCNCTACGAVISFPINLLSGSDQFQVVECSVCHNRVTVYIQIEESGDVRVRVDH